MDTTDRIDRLLSEVERMIATGELIDDMSKLEELCRLDAEICGECNYLGVAMQSFDFVGERARFYGFTQIPYARCGGGWDFIKSEHWEQAMRGLREAVRIGIERLIDPADKAMAKSHAKMTEYALEHFGKKCSERSIQHWIDDKSLRVVQRGQIWEFSVSDLRTCVLGRSDLG
jgi:hypothetical protein